MHESVSKSALGYVVVYESSDGGSGDPSKTFWQFFIEDDAKNRQPVTTSNPLHAETARFAVDARRKVMVTYDAANGNAISQIRMEFSYVCEYVEIMQCESPMKAEPAKVAICEPRLTCEATQIPLDTTESK